MENCAEGTGAGGSCRRQARVSARSLGHCGGESDSLWKRAVLAESALDWGVTEG